MKQLRSSVGCRWARGASAHSVRAALGVGLATLVLLLGGAGRVGAQSPSASGSFIEVYKDYGAWWGENTDEEILPGLGYAPGAANGYEVLPTSALRNPIPSRTKLVLITSNSFGWQSTEDNVNSPAAQANLTAFVQAGGVLVIHMANNYLATNFIAPAGTTVTQGEDAYTTQIAPGAATHPILLGPDGIAGTGDDLTLAILTDPLEFQTHGMLNLPAGATQILLSCSGQPVLAEYSLGLGRVVVTTFTMELWRLRDVPAGRVFVNEIAYAISRVAGADATPPTVAASATPTVLWPPNGAMIPVVVSGLVSDNLSGVDLSSGKYSVVDDYGLVQPWGTFTVQSNGRYSVTFQLRADRTNQGSGSRQYTVTIQAKDKAGNLGKAVVVVTVPHDQGTSKGKGK